MSEVKSEIGRIISGGYYDIQEMRISAANRIRDIIRKKVEGVGFGEVEKPKKKDDKDYYKKFDDKKIPLYLDLLERKKEITSEESKYISNTLKLLENTETLEANYKTNMMKYIEGEPVYKEFLSKIKGLGPVLSANLIKEFGDCSKYDTISKLWSHTGNSVEGGTAPKKRKGENLKYSPRLRTLTWKVSDCLLKSNKGLYRNVYDTEKQRSLSRKYKKGELFKLYGKPYTEDTTKLSQGHSHARALRKIRKLFLSHYWAASRELAGLDTRSPFAESIGHKNIVTWKDAVRKEQTTTVKAKPKKKKAVKKATKKKAVKKKTAKRLKT